MIDNKQASQLLKVAVKLLDSKPPSSDLKWDELLGSEPFSKSNSRALEYIMYLCYLKINGRAKTLKSEVGRLWAPLDQFDSSVAPPPRDKEFPREFRVAMKDWITNSLASQGLIDGETVKTFTVAYQAASGPRTLELLCTLVFLALQHDLKRSFISNNTNNTQEHTTTNNNDNNTVLVETHTIIAALDALQQLWEQSHAEEIMPCLSDKGTDKASRLVAISSSSSPATPVLNEFQSSVCCLDIIRCRLRMMHTTNNNNDGTQVVSSLAALKALSYQVSHDIHLLSCSSSKHTNNNKSKLPSLDRHLLWLEDLSLLASRSTPSHNPLMMMGVLTECDDHNSIPTLSGMIHDAKSQVKCTVHKQVGDSMMMMLRSDSTREKQAVEEVQFVAVAPSSPLSLAIVQQQKEEEEEEEGASQPSPHLHIHPSTLPDAHDLSDDDGDLERLMSSSPLPTPTVRMTNQHRNDVGNDGWIVALPSPPSPPQTVVLIEQQHPHQQQAEQPDREVAAATTTPSCDGKLPAPKRLSMTPMVVLSKLGGRKNVLNVGITAASPGGKNREGRGGTSLVKEVEETTPVVISKQRRRATSGFATLMKKMQNLRRRKATDGDE
jgi:hypothetical protein